MSAQQQLQLSRNGHLGLRRKRRVCGYCGFNVTINVKGGAMRVHGPKNNRCIGSGVKWLPVFHHSFRNGGVVKRWGTCGVCGDVTEYPDSDPKASQPDLASRTYMGKHAHDRPRIGKDRADGTWYVKSINTRTGKSLTINCESLEEAQRKAVELIELQK